MAKKKKDKSKVEKVALPADLQTSAARITEVTRVLSDHPSNSITPSKLKSLFDDAENGDITAQHELYMDIEERDSAIGSAVATRKNAILTLDYRIAPPRNPTPAEDKLAEAADELIDGIDGFEDLLLDMMDSVGHGFAPIEIEWEMVNGLHLPVSFTHRPQAWFRWDKEDGYYSKRQITNRAKHCGHWAGWCTSTKAAACKRREMVYFVH
ncbi:DUF935 family protein [Snodgrassella sp. CFCC 13594]|uniref:phage portal protein family protein n=1 Tax=Snodgrassella sp. CFCC 13594 TaxID=1775559 RepID=UPI000A9C8759|nr:DUF935 family protein [Snodgrassella sp. CFCC 13594]